MNSVIIFCAQYLIYLLIILAFSYWLTLPKKQKVQVVVYGVITALVAFILAKIGSSIFFDARPFVSDHLTPLFKHVADNGFPSDHTLFSASIAVAVFLVSKKWGIGFFVLSIIIGSSRVFANVHHPIDILGGLVFAIIGGVAANYAAPVIISNISKHSRRFKNS